MSKQFADRHVLWNLLRRPHHGLKTEAGFQVTGDEIFDVQHAQNLIQRSIAHRVTSVLGAPDHGERVLKRFVDIDEIHLAAVAWSAERVAKEYEQQRKLVSP